MDLLGNIDALTKTLIGVSTLVGLVFGFLRWVKPRMDRWSADGVAVRDAILGREPVVDSITGLQLAPALPGIGVRMATVERAVATLVDQHTRLDNLEHRVGALEEAAKASPDDDHLPGLGEN